MPDTLQQTQLKQTSWFLVAMRNGLIILIGLNAASYFFAGMEFNDLLCGGMGSGSQTESWGWPYKVWDENKPPGVSEGTLNYVNLAYNLKSGLAIGLVLWLLSIAFRSNLESARQREFQNRLHSADQEHFLFQVSLKTLLVFITLAAVSLACLSVWNESQTQPVKSSNIKMVGYNRITKTLEIKFHQNRTYLYSNVPPKIYHEMMVANSKGRYFAANIRDQFKTQGISWKAGPFYLVSLFLGPAILWLISCFVPCSNRMDQILTITLLALLWLVWIVCGWTGENSHPDRTLLAFFVCWTPQFVAWFCLASLVRIATNANQSPYSPQTYTHPPQTHTHPPQTHTHPPQTYAHPTKEAEKSNQTA